MLIGDIPCYESTLSYSGLFEGVFGGRNEEIIKENTKVYIQFYEKLAKMTKSVFENILTLWDKAGGIPPQNVELANKLSYSIELYKIKLSCEESIEKLNNQLEIAIPQRLCFSNHGIRERMTELKGNPALFDDRTFKLLICDQKHIEKLEEKLD